MATEGNGVYYFDSDMVDAPVLSGTAGAQKALIKACLVDGFGSEAPQGDWEVSWESGHEMAIHSTAVTGTGLFLRVDDSSAKTTIVRGYESVDGSGVGTAAFNAVDWYWFKSNAEDATSRGWVLIADSYSFYLFNYWHLSYLTNSEGYFFGDPVSYRPTGDNFNCALIANVLLGTPYPGGNSSAQTNFYNINTTSSVGHALARAHTQIGGAVSFEKYALGLGGRLGWTDLTGPSTMMNGEFFSEVVVKEANEIRGKMPGIYSPSHHLYPLDKTLWLDVPNIGSMLFIRLGYGTGTDYGRVGINLTGPWR